MNSHGYQLQKREGIFLPEMQCTTAFTRMWCSVESLYLQLLLRDSCAFPQYQTMSMFFIRVYKHVELVNKKRDHSKGRPVKVTTPCSFQVDTNNGRNRNPSLLIWNPKAYQNTVHRNTQPEMHGLAH
jgi:hypothetical protein